MAAASAGGTAEEPPSQREFHMQSYPPANSIAVTNGPEPWIARVRDVHKLRQDSAADSPEGANPSNTPCVRRVPKRASGRARQQTRDKDAKHALAHRAA